MKKNPSSKRKLPNTWTKRDTVWSIMASICILIFVIYYSTLYIHAENSYFPMGQNDNGLFSETALNFINSHYDSENNYIFARSYGTLSGGRPAFCVFYWPKNSDTMYYSELLNNGYQFSLYKSGSANPTMKYFYINNGTCTEYTWTQANWNQNFQNQNSSLYSNSVSYVSNFQVYKNANKDTVVLKFGESPFEVAEGHATQPNFDTNDNINTDGHAQQPNTPQFPQFPTVVIDTTNVETLLESIFESITSVGDFVGQCFSTFFSWLVEVIKNVGQSIYNAIIDTAQFLYSNFVSLFEPMMVNVGHAVEPVQESEIVQAFEDTGIYEDFLSVTDLVNDSFDVFDSIDEPNTFVIPIHLENVTMLNCGTQYIDLGWFDSCKTALRAFMWCITTFGLLYTIIDALPSYISGGDE